MTRVHIYMIGVSLTGLFAACGSDAGDRNVLDGVNAPGGSAAGGMGGAVSTGGSAVSGTGGTIGENRGGTGSVVTQTSGGTGGAVLGGTKPVAGEIDAGLGDDATSGEGGGGSEIGDAGNDAASGGTQTGDTGAKSEIPDASTGETKDAGQGAMISIDDPVPGFASEAGGTTGGGKNLAGAILVSSMIELLGATSGFLPAIVLVQPGNYVGELSPGANKTIVGTGPGVKIRGSLKISGSDRNNIIVRNIAVQGEMCFSYDWCKEGADAVYVGNGAHHVWLDHLDVSDGQDGNCDITQGGDYVTVSWTNFYYTYNKEHRFSNLIAGSDDEPASVGKLHITYMNSHWGERVDQRQPRGRFGNIHMLNNYHSTGGSQIHGVGKDMAIIAENSVYDERISIWKDMGSPRGWKGIGNIGTGRDLNDSRGTVFDIPYSYTAMPASEVVAAVTSSECGAGNTCVFAQ